MGNEINVNAKSAQQSSKITLRRPTIDGNTVTYFDGQKWQKIKVSSIGLYLSQGIHDLAFKDKNRNHGNIKKKDALELLQNMFSANENVRVSGGHTIKKYAGVMSDIKSMFDLYMDKESDGGENITQQEQFKIMRTIATWFGYED